MRSGKTLFVVALALSACGGQKTETNTAVNEKRGESHESAPRPPADEDLKAQQQQAAERARKASAGERAEFVALVDKYETAKKQPGGIPDTDCSSWAKKFIGQFGTGPFAAQAHFNGGTIYESCGRAKDAEAEYNEALRANGGYAPALSNLGELYYKQGNVQTARQWFEKAIAADPTHASTAYYNLALIMYNDAKQANDLNGYKEAVGRLRRALAIDSESVAAYALLAQIYYQTAESDRSKLDLAALVCKQAKETNDKYAPVYNTLGLINLRKKNVTGALKEFEKAVELDPKFVEAHLNIGAIGLSVRQYDKAEKSFQAVLALQPNNFDATVGMGVAERGLRKFDEAEKWYRKAAELDSKNCSVPYDLGLLYQDYKTVDDNSNNKTAQDYYRKFLSCGGNANPKKIEDAQRRIKDIDDLFAQLEEQKKMQEESDRMQKQMQEQQKQMEQQEKQQQQQQPPAAGAGAAAPTSTGNSAGKTSK